MISFPVRSLYACAFHINCHIMSCGSCYCDTLEVIFSPSISLVSVTRIFSFLLFHIWTVTTLGSNPTHYFQFEYLVVQLDKIK